MGFKVHKNTIKKGLDDYKKSLGTAGELAVARGLEVIRSTVVDVTPVDTGRLKNSIGSKVAIRGIKGSGEGIFEVEKTGHKVVGTIGTNVPYARHVEFGTSKSRPRYFFTLGFAFARDKVRKVIINTLKDANRN
jgi:HK97 gp10 family phage protein